MTVVWMFNIKFVRKVTKDSCFTSFSLKDMVSGLSPLLFRKLSNPDIFSPTGKAKLQRQLSQDDCKLRRGSLASSLSGKYRTCFFFAVSPMMRAGSLQHWLFSFRGHPEVFDGRGTAEALHHSAAMRVSGDGTCKAAGQRA